MYYVAGLCQNNAMRAPYRYSTEINNLRNVKLRSNGMTIDSGLDWRKILKFVDENKELFYVTDSSPQ